MIFVLWVKIKKKTGVGIGYPGARHYIFMFLWNFTSFFVSGQL